MTEPEFAAIAARLKERYKQVKSASSKVSFLMHLETMTRWQEAGEARIEAAAAFPPTVPIAFAVCHPTCGTAELIVEGSTQECQRCGRLMFRMETREYKRVDE